MRKTSQATSCVIAMMAVLAFGSSADAQVRPRNSPPPTQSIPPEIEALLDRVDEFNSDATWLVAPRPTEHDFPARALSRGISGSATVACITPADGLIRFCKVIEESTPGVGFGEAAIAIVSRSKLNPSDDPNKINVFKVRVPFTIG